MAMMTSGTTVKQLKDALGCVPDDTKVEFVAQDLNITDALKTLCSKIGIDITKFNKSDVDQFINDIAYSVYIGGHKLTGLQDT